MKCGSGILGEGETEVVVEPDWVIPGRLFSRPANLRFIPSHGFIQRSHEAIHRSRPRSFYHVRILRRQLILRNRFRKPEKRCSRSFGKEASTCLPNGVHLCAVLALRFSVTALTILTVRIMQQVALCYIRQCNVTTIRTFCPAAARFPYLKKFP